MADASPRPEAGARRQWFGARHPRARWGLLAAVVLGLGIHVAAPALAGIERSIDVVRGGDLRWIAAAALCSAASLTCYVGVFRFVVVRDLPGVGWRGSYQVAMASQGASTVVTAGGAGGLALFYWALPRQGLPRPDVPVRILAFLVFHYAIYLAAIAVFGFALGFGLFPGSAPASLTVVPAIVSSVLLLLGALTVRNGERIEQGLRREEHRDARGRIGRLAARLAGVPASIAAALRYSASLLRPARRGLLITGLAIGYWATNIGILECCFLAFGQRPDLAGLVLAFFIGSAANLLPLLPGGVGSVEAGLIGSLLAFGEPGAQVVVSVLSFRLIGYWAPTIPEAIAYVQVRRALGGRPDDEAAPAGAVPEQP